MIILVEVGELALLALPLTLSLIIILIKKRVKYILSLTKNALS